VLGVNWCWNGRDGFVLALKVAGNSEFPGAKSRLGVNQPVRWSPSSPRLSLTAWLSFCLQPKWRSVVSTDACLANTESDQSHLLPDGTIARRSGAGIGGKVRHGGTLCSRFYYVPYRFRCDVLAPDFVQATQRRKIEPVLIPTAVIQSLAARSPHAGIGTVRKCFRLPTRSTITQCSFSSARAERKISGTDPATFALSAVQMTVGANTPIRAGTNSLLRSTIKPALRHGKNNQRHRLTG
jgi:hypothetical protein